jgi:hypothetical protein
MRQRLAASVALAGVLLGTVGCGTEPAVVALKNARSESAALKALQRLVDEKGGDVLADAFCTGATSYIDKDRSPTNDDWANFILSQAGSPANQFREKTDQLGAALDLAEHNSSAAANAYVRACLAR